MDHQVHHWVARGGGAHFSCLSKAMSEPLNITSRWSASSAGHPLNRNRKLEYPQRYAALTLAFKGERHSGWRWGFGQDSEVLSRGQVRLGYAITSSLISLTMDGIVNRMFGHHYEQRQIGRLGESMIDIMQEEVLLYLEARQLAAVDLKDGEDGKEEVTNTEPRKLRFMVFEGVRLAESLLFEHCREDEVGHIHDKSSRILTQRHHHIQSI